MNPVMKISNSRPPPEGTPGPFSLSDVNILNDYFIKSEFKGIAFETMDVTFEFDSAESYTRLTYETAGPLHAMLVNETEDRRKEILKAITESTNKYVGNSPGKIELSNEAICVVGKK